MHVVVGSGNPVKRDAVVSCLERYDPVVQSVPVDSGVSDQPRGIQETRRGARTRARRAHEAIAAADYGVGLEGGVALFDDTATRSLIMWVAVTDGTRVRLAGGPTIELPASVTERLADGAELGSVMNDLVGRCDVAETSGATGVLTDGLTDRERALELATACAFGPFLTPHYDL